MSATAAAACHSQETIEILDPTLRSGFVQLPRPVLRTPNLSANAKCLYALLLDYAWADGHCFPGQARLAASLGLTDRSVRAHLGELREKNLVAWKRRGKTKTNVYFILPIGNNPVLTDPIAPHFSGDRKNSSDRKRNSASDHERKPASANVDSEHQTQRLLLDPGNFSKAPATPSKRQLLPQPAAVPTSQGSKQAATSTPSGNAHSATSPQPSSASNRGRPPTPTPAIASYLTQWSRELHDPEHTKANITRAMRLLQSSGLAEDEFLQVLFEARRITKERGNIEKVASSGAPTKNRMPYLFAVIEDLLGMKEEVPHTPNVAHPQQENTEQEERDDTLLCMWQKVLVELTESLGKETFNKWLRDTTLTAYNDQEAVVQCQTDHIAQWLTLRLNKKITDAFHTVVGHPITVSYIVPA